MTMGKRNLRRKLMYASIQLRGSMVGIPRSLICWSPVGAVREPSLRRSATVRTQAAQHKRELLFSRLPLLKSRLEIDRAAFSKEHEAIGTGQYAVRARHGRDADQPVQCQLFRCVDQAPVLPTVGRIEDHSFIANRPADLPVKHDVIEGGLDRALVGLPGPATVSALQNGPLHPYCAAPSIISKVHAQER